ncbi:heavy metal-associated isoprenylated plant protein 41 [Eucalyptus grandis]|uniref:heavy metal-associated isoprenylated plant protein 41 n=1 Tax=Eucalyptus grandis TaxID=71139 RepID=UPI00192E7C87|nr:heavy metal-associated isoprenylated plant protein 41 [Eucalyptus grandis]
MQRVIIQVDWDSEKSKKKAIKMVSKNQDVESFSVNDEKKQLTLEGEMDPVPLVKKMRKEFPTQIIAMTQISVEAQPQQPRSSPETPYHPNPQPPAPPYWGHDGYHYPQFHPTYGQPQYPGLPNWGQPSAPPLYGGHNIHHPFQ